MMKFNNNTIMFGEFCLETCAPVTGEKASAEKDIDDGFTTVMYKGKSCSESKKNKPSAEKAYNLDQLFIVDGGKKAYAEYLPFRTAMSERLDNDISLQLRAIVKRAIKKLSETGYKVNKDGEVIVRICERAELIASIPYVVEVTFPLTNPTPDDIKKGVTGNMVRMNKTFKRELPESVMNSVIRREFEADEKHSVHDIGVDAKGYVVVKLDSRLFVSTTRAMEKVENEKKQAVKKAEKVDKYDDIVAQYTCSKSKPNKRN